MVKFSFENNIIISSINISTKSGGPIPIIENGQKKYKKDKKQCYNFKSQK